MNEEERKEETPVENQTPDKEQIPSVDQQLKEAGLPPVPTRIPGEVVEYYQHENGREVVEYYFQPTPYPGKTLKPAPQKRKKKKKGLWIFLACAVVIVGLAASAYFWGSNSSTGDSSAQGGSETQSDGEAITIPIYDGQDGVTLHVAAGKGAALTAQEIYAKVNPSVVTVVVDLKGGSASVGTGVIFTADGYVLTNYHVVSGGKSCYVTLSDDTSYDAQYVAGDADNDLAVLKVEGENLPAAEIGSSDDLTVGDKVYAIGNPLGVELRGTFTDGIVSAINRDVEVDGRTMTLVQTNAALNSGNSGGPLINEYGQVVGINTIKMSSAFSSIEGLGFAIPTSSMQYIVNDLLEYGTVLPEPKLGISVSKIGVTLPTGQTGVQVLDVTKGSAADRAGVLVDDVIVSADGENVSKSSDLLRIRRRFNVGDTMSLTLYRGGTPQEVVLEFQDSDTQTTQN